MVDDRRYRPPPPPQIEQIARQQMVELLALLRSIDARLARLADFLNPATDKMSKLKTEQSERWFPTLPSIYKQEDHQNERVIPRYSKEGK